MRDPGALHSSRRPSGARLPAALAAFLVLAGCGAKPGGTTAAQREVPAEEGTLLDREGSLGEGDLRLGAGFADHFEVPVRLGERVTVELESSTFDPLLEVVPPGAGALVNDDYQGDRTRSRIDLVAAAAGTLKIRVTSYAPGATGAYRLRVVRAVTPAAVASLQMAAVLVPGASLRGELADGDATLPGGAFYDQLHVEVADAPVELRVRALEGPAPQVEVLDPSGRAQRVGAEGAITLVGAGLHRAIVAGATPGGRSRYEASASSGAGAPPPAAPARANHASPAAAGAAALTLGQHLRGELRQGDAQLPSGELADVYALEGRAGTPVSIELRSDAFDAYLLVEGPGGRRWENDDFGGARHSAVAFALPADGSYRVVATTYRVGEAGAYELKVFEDRRSVLAEAPQVSAPAPAPAPAPAQGQATVRRTGALAPGDAQLRTGEHMDSYSFVWQAGQQVRVALRSSEFDTYVIVVAPSGAQQDNDDVSSGDTSSLVQMQVAETGPHRVIVTSYRPGEAGAYELVVEGGGAATVASPQPGPAVAHGGGFQTITGSLAAGDGTLRSGELVDEHRFDWVAGQPVRLEARSSDFDTYLMVRPPTGAQQDNDDQAPGDTNAALDFVAAEAGPHRVLVTSYRPGEQGRYELLVGAPGAPAVAQGGAPTPAPEAGEVIDAAPGREVRGALAQGDPTLRRGEHADTLRMRFAPGQAVRLSLESSAFDTYLIVRTPSGRQIDNDDVAPGTLHSAVDLPRAEAGEHTVIVTSYAPGQTGPWRLAVAAGAAVPGPAVATGPGPAQGGQGGQGAAGSGGRVFGVFAGITDYPPGVSDLDECANDAVKLAQTLRQAGLLSEDRQVLLTDAQATRANVQRAMTDMARRVGPDDVFIFFYSGHGGRHDDRQSQDRREIDGHDEYLFVHDGEILDDQMGTWFDGINARLSVLALDACFAGGFAKDVITRPGRLGLFSSEEDVTSAVAGAFQAGGYLSHFLRTGISGEADADPRDGVLTVGELTHYLTLQFGNHVRDVRMGEGYQHLVVDRGAVGTRHVMWAYR